MRFFGRETETAELLKIREDSKTAARMTVVTGRRRVGKTVLIEEFGRDYGTYFAILAGIASGRTTFAELSALLGVDVGGYLTKLERDYSIVSQTRPIFEKTRRHVLHQHGRMVGPQRRE